MSRSYGAFLIFSATAVFGNFTALRVATGTLHLGSTNPEPCLLNVKLRRREEFLSVVARVLTHAADARLALEAFSVATLRGQTSSEGKSSGDYLIDYGSANHQLKIALVECELLMPKTAQQATSLSQELALGKRPITVTENRGAYDAVRTDFIIAARRCLPK